MINNRAVLLSIIALVAMIAQTMGDTYSAATFEDGQQLEKLDDNNLSIRKFKKILSKIEFKKGSKIAGISVAEISDQLSKTGSSAEDCQNDALARSLECVRALELVPSVHNCVNAHYSKLLKYCHKYFRLIFEGQLQLTKLSVQNLEIINIRSIFDSITDKINVKIGQFSVQAILDQASSNGLTMQDCQRDEILKRRKIFNNHDLTFVLNVYAFTTSHQEELRLYCVENIKRVFRDNERLLKLNDNRLTTGEVVDILGFVEDKENVKFGDVSVAEIRRLVREIGSLLECRKSYALERWSKLLKCLETGESVRNFAKDYYKRLIQGIFDKSWHDLGDENQKKLRQLPTFFFNSSNNRMEGYIRKHGLCEPCRQLIKFVKFLKSTSEQAEGSEHSFDSFLVSINRDEWKDIHVACDTIVTDFCEAS